MAHALCLEPVQNVTVTAIAELRPRIPLVSVLQASEQTLKVWLLD